jgi:RNA polymerase sigma-19 factor, ECF subfamily
VAYASGIVPNPSTDLARRIRGGDTAAFEELFRAHYEGLCRFAYRYLNDTSLAEDLVQELFTDLWADHGHLELRGSVRAYLYAAVRNRALNHRKHQLVECDWERNEAMSNVRELHRPPVPVDEPLDIAERDATVNAAIQALPERCRLVMQLRWREQLSYAEIAAVMGISIKGVEIQLSRGLQSLRHRLGVHPTH